MDAQRSHFRRYLSITLIVLFMLTLAALGYATWAVERGNLQGWELLLNVLILSLPLLLIYGSVYVLLLGWHERSSLGKVSPGLEKIIRWAPRLAALLIILFTGLFSLDVFGTGAPPLEVLEAFLRHNLPSIAMLVLLILAWKRPVVGFVAFLVSRLYPFLCPGLLCPDQPCALCPPAAACRIPVLCGLEMAVTLACSVCLCEYYANS